MVSLALPKVPRAWNYWILLVVYLLFLVLGTLVFMGIEAPHEAVLRRQVMEAREHLLKEHHHCLEPVTLDKLLAEVVLADNYGISLIGNATGVDNWEFTSSLFFVASVLTTTGYGHTVPLSNGGKIFCIVYTFLGIPITLFLLTYLVQRLMALVTTRPVRYIITRWGYPPGPVAIAHAMMLGLLVAICFIILPAFIFWAVEDDWNFLESVYFCFISLSTIGLGDYIPGKATRPALRQLYKFSITCYLILGLIAMLLALETFSALPDVRSFLRLFFNPKHKQIREDDRLGILSQDELAMESEVADPTPLAIISGAANNHPQRTELSGEGGQTPGDAPQE